MADPYDRMEKLLAMLILEHMKDRPQRDKVRVLNLAGLSNVEIADLLDTTAQVVAQILYIGRKGKSAPRKRRTEASAARK